MMKRIVNKTLTPIYDFVGFLTLMFSQIFIIILLIFHFFIFFNLVNPTLSDKFFLLGTVVILNIFSYFIVKSIIIALKYFFSVEECFCEKGVFFYKKILFNKIKIKTFSLPVNEIVFIEDLGKRVIEAEKNTVLNYFKPNERIGIKLMSGDEYKIWNYVRKRKLFSIDNTYDKDEDFFLALEKIKNFVREEQLNQKI